MTVSVPAFCPLPVRSTGHERTSVLLALGIAGIALLGGCSSERARPDQLTRAADDSGDREAAPRAIAQAEAAVLADGRNAALRLALANAYLHAGRFESARAAYADVIELGDDSSRAALGLVLSDLALGRHAAALDTLNTYGDVLTAADLGLALTMAGQNERGIAVLTTAVRQGQKSARLRLNLAYAYALSGMWAEAKVIAAQDIPANQLDARLQSWALLARPDQDRRRVASLIGAPTILDSGQPQALALAKFTTPMAAVRAQAAAPVVASAATTAPVVPAIAPRAAPVAAVTVPPSSAAAAPTAHAVSVVAKAIPAVTAKPARAVLAHSTLSGKTALVSARGTHLVQLGSFSSNDAAQRAWSHYAKRNSRLASHPSMITKVNVHGRDFWRLQAAGFAGQASATTLCGTLRAHGGVCLVMALNAAAKVAISPAQSAARVVAQPARIRPAAAHPAQTRQGRTLAAG